MRGTLGRYESLCVRLEYACAGGVDADLERKEMEEAKIEEETW